ncbi:MAG: hypothetical protein FJX72_13505, partial [Armatimonadetes bacterium]|nr:hypothetical protein [Armatimonadota bacterium]
MRRARVPALEKRGRHRWRLSAPGEHALRPLRAVSWAPDELMRGHPVFYVTGGSLRADAPCYVERVADADILAALGRGELCYVLTPRQMGKSSLKVRTAARLRADGARVVVLDLTSVGRNLTPEQWYFGLLGHLFEQLGMERELERLWDSSEAVGPLQRFMRCLDTAARACRAKTPPGLVVFVDEIDVVLSLPFQADEFLAAIRELYNRRSSDEAARSITFCLLGAAAPTDLVRDPRTTPFNVGVRVELTDFADAEASVLGSGLCSRGQACRP